MKYKIAENLDENTEKELQNYPELTKKLLANRGIKTAQEADVFLNPDYEKHQHEPFLMKNMGKAVDRILRAIKENEKTVIFSDYDMDGIPGAVALHDFFKKIGYENFINYIPHRNREGFGLNKEAMEQFASQNAKLLITIDCGITNVKETELANEKGIDVIITDHHLPNLSPICEQVGGGKNPPAHAILNPKQKGDKYPFKELCGAGIVFELIQGVIQKGRERDVINLPNGWEKWILDMVGIATIGDRVSLVGENRIFAHFGLKVLRKSPRVGLKKMLGKMNVNQNTITEDEVGFMIGPRINAASRMDAPDEAFNLLVTKDEIEADKISDHLNNINDQRKGFVASIIKEVKRKARLYEKKPVLIAGNLEWNPGLVGLACTNLVEEYEKPVFLWGRDEGFVIKGSCRSDGTIDLVKLMSEVNSGTLIEYGGHSFSGGFSVYHEKIHIFEEEILLAYEKTEKFTDGENKKNFIDAELAIDDVDENLFNQINTLAPFGEGNPKPTFLFRNILLDEVLVFGKRKEHLKIGFRDDAGEKIYAINFFKTPDDFGIKKGDKISLVANIEKTSFRNISELRLRIIDIINSRNV